MGYADVLHPMVVNVSKTASFSIENHLRRMCIVSQGDSKLAVGSFETVDSTTYTARVKENTEAGKMLRTFFSYAGNKPVVLLEVGKSTLEASVNKLKGFLDSEELKTFNVLVPDSWYNVKQPDKVYSAIMAETILRPTSDEQALDITFTNIEAGQIEVEGLTKVELNLTKMTYKLKEVNTDLTDTETVTLKYTIGGTKKMIGQLKFNKNGGSDKSSLNFIEQVSLTPDTSFVKLLTEYDNIDKENLFFMTLPKTADPNADPNFTYFKGMKSIHLVSDNTDKDTINSAAAVVGITASNIFDISSSTPASSLNYKQVKSYTPIVRSATLKNQLIQNGVTLIDSLASNTVLLNGRQMDGQPWEYYYYWYLTKLEVHSKITLLLLNGSNNPVAAIGFDQDGIDTIHANIVSKLKELQDLGVITSFAQSYDGGTGEFTGLGDIVCPNYYEFIVSNPDDYVNEKLTGISCYIQIGKFIRQVEWNVTLGA